MDGDTTLLAVTVTDSAQQVGKGDSMHDLRLH